MTEEQAVTDEGEDVDAKSQPPVSAAQMQTIVKKVRDMDDDPDAIINYIDKEMKAAGLERLPSSYESNNMHFYGRNASIKESDTSYLFEINDNDGIVVQVISIEENMMEVVFKNKAWLNAYRKGITALPYMKVPFFNNSVEKYAEVGGIDFFSVEDETDDGLSTVTYAAPYWEEPFSLSSDDAIEMMGKQLGKAKEVAETRNYELAMEDFDDDGDGDVYFTEGCKMEADNSEFGFKAINTGEEYTSYSMLKLILEGNVVKGLMLNLYGLRGNDHIEEFIHNGFELTDSAENSRVFKNKKNKMVASVTEVDDLLTSVVVKLVDK